MVILNLKKKSETPLFKQVINQLISKIDNDTLKPGEKLPSTRNLSNVLGVNRTTIYKAYQELWALGYIESRSGSYSFVRQRRELKTTNKEILSNSIDWSTKINPDAEKIYQLFGKVNYPFSEEREFFDGIDFGRLHPDTRFFPINEFKKSLNKVINEKGDIVFDYGKTKGNQDLREFIALRSRKHGISVGVDEILITNGAQNAIDLLLKFLAKPNSRVFVESPTYGMIIPLLKYYNCEIVPIPMLDDGIDINFIKKEFKNGLPAFLYTMPNFQNPTGITTSQEHREKLISLFEKYNIPIIEDAYEEEMKYFGKVPLSIKSMDVSQIVFYIGSFSKVLFPGIRLGWIAADKQCIERLATLKRFSDLSSAVPEQAALAEFCNSGNYELHIKKIHKIFRKRMMMAVQMLSEKITNKNVSWIEPNGGYTIWLSLDKLNLSYEEMNRIFYKNKVRTALGKDFFPIENKKRHCRLSISSLDENEITKGLERINKSINEFYEINNVVGI